MKINRIKNDKILEEMYRLIDGYSGHIVPVIPGMLCHWKQV